MDQNTKRDFQYNEKEGGKDSAGFGWLVILFIVIGIALSFYFLRGMFFDVIKKVYESVSHGLYEDAFQILYKNGLNLFYCIIFALLSIILLVTYGSALKSEKKLIKFLRTYMTSDRSLDSVISNDSKIKNICVAYKDSFLKYGNTQYTRSNSDLYFGTEAWLSATTKRPTVAFLKIIPGIFVGLGILGTFIGFSSGVSNIHFIPSAGESLDINELMNGVSVLLNGLQSAFVTSIIGVVASILLNVFVVHPFFRRMDNETRLLCDILDKNFYLTEVDALALKDSNTGDMIAFPESIKTIILKLDTVSNNMSAMTKEMAEKFEGLNISLSKVKENDLSYVAQTVKDAMGEIISNEMTRLRNEMNAMITVIKECRENMESSPEHLRMASQALNDALKSIVAQEEKNLSVIEQQNSAFSSFEESIGNVDSLLEKFKNTMEVAQGAMTQAYGQFANAIGGAEVAMEKNQEWANKLSEAVLTSSQNMDLAVESLEKMHSIYSASAETNKELLNGFQQMDESISSVLEKFNEQTIRYSDVVAKSLEDYLKEFLDATNGISTRFAESVDSLSKEISRLNGGNSAESMGNGSAS